jgi:hypothetical protein
MSCEKGIIAIRRRKQMPTKEAIIPYRTIVGQQSDPLRLIGAQGVRFRNESFFIFLTASQNKYLVICRLLLILDRAKRLCLRTAQL